MQSESTAFDLLVGPVGDRWVSFAAPITPRAGLQRHSKALRRLLHPRACSVAGTLVRVCCQKQSFCLYCDTRAAG